MKTTQLGIELGSRHLRIAATKKEEFLKRSVQLLIAAYS